METESSFSRNDTLLIKGIAIVAMVWHHTYPNDPGLTYALNIEIYGKLYFQVVLAEMCKICVPLFTILSGMGIAYGYKNLDEQSFVKVLKFICSHMLQLYSVWWSALVVLSISNYMQGLKLSFFYGNGISGVKNFTYDFFGISVFTGTGSMVATGWYMSMILLFYMLFPLIFTICKMLGFVVVAIAYIPWIYYLFKADITMHTDCSVFYIGAFSLGVVLAQTIILDRIKNNSDKELSILACLVLIIAIVLRIVFALPADIYLSLAVIVFAITFSGFRIPVIRETLILLGECSALMWLLHGHVGGNYIGIDNTVYQFILNTFFSLAISMLIKKINDITGYTRAIRVIRDRLK